MKRRNRERLAVVNEKPHGVMPARLFFGSRFLIDIFSGIRIWKADEARDQATIQGSYY
jgi:hypothetical protein